MIETMILFLGGLKVDGYYFHFVDHCRQDIRGLEGNCLGWVREWNTRHVWIVSGHTIEDVERTCDHEMFHILGNRERFREMNKEKFKSDHEIMKNGTSPIGYPTCGRLTHEKYLYLRGE